MNFYLVIDDNFSSSALIVSHTDSWMAARRLHRQAAFHVSEERGSQRIGDGAWMPRRAGVLSHVLNDVHLWACSKGNLPWSVFPLFFFFWATTVALEISYAGKSLDKLDNSTQQELCLVCRFIKKWLLRYTCTALHSPAVIHWLQWDVWLCELLWRDV